MEAVKMLEMVECLVSVKMCDISCKEERQECWGARFLKEEIWARQQLAPFRLATWLPQPDHLLATYLLVMLERSEW